MSSDGVNSRQGLNYKQVADILFTTNPKPPNSIRIQLEQMELRHMFEVLFSIFLEGYRILFGIHHSLGFNELCRMNEYMKSIGFIVNQHHTKSNVAYCKYNYPISMDTNPTITIQNSCRDDQLVLTRLSDYYVDMQGYQLNLNQYVC